MKKVIFYVPFIILIFVFTSCNQQKNEVIKWEYMITAVPDLTFNSSMNKLGEEGWEMVFARRAMSDNKYAYEIIFKRPKREKPGNKKVTELPPNQKETVKNLQVAIVKSKYKNTMMDLKTIGTAVESYMTDNYKAPENLTFGGEQIRAFHIKKFPETDAWGNKWYYKRDPKNTDVYWIGSAGSDGKFDGFNQKGNYSSLNGNDIIYSNGAFEYCPSGE